MNEWDYFDLSRQDTIEYLSAVLAAEVALGEWFVDYPYTYYQRPDSTFQPGKNVLDAMRHWDDAYVTHTLYESTSSWTGLFTTNLQAPGARKVKVYTLANTFDPTANPVFYLRFGYYNESGVWTYHDTGTMCASIDPLLNAPCLGKPRTHEWTDFFAPNTDMVVEYRRPEGGAFVVDRDVDFKVYVEETESVADDLSDPRLSTLGNTPSGSRSGPWGTPPPRLSGAATGPTTENMATSSSTWNGSPHPTASAPC